MSSAAEGGASTSATPQQEEMEVQKQTSELLAQGKRNLICQEIPNAVQNFQEACKMLSSHYGEMSKECADAYFHYGSALLDLSRMEQGVLGNALQGVDVDADDEGGPFNKDQFERTDKIDEEERMELRQKVVDAMSEDEISNQALLATGKSPKPGKNTFEGVLDKEAKEEMETEGDKEESEDKEQESSKPESDQDKPEDMEAEDEESKGGEESSGRVTGRQSSIEKKVAAIAIEEAGDEVDGEQEMEPGDASEAKGEDVEVLSEEEDGEEEEEGEAEEGDEKAGSDAEGEENPDDISNLQLSWETLDLAKTIYSKDPSKESQLKAAESHLKLGEISLEEDRFTDALTDMEKCLTIQKQHLEPCNRAIAETYYQMGLACQTNEEWNKAKDHFSSALKCLESKIESLQVIVTEKPPKSPSKTVEPADQAQQEIKEIEEILPDIKEKIKDAEIGLKTAEQFKAMAKQALGNVFGAVPDSTSSDSGLPEKSSCSSSTSSEPQKTMDITHLVRKKDCVQRKPEEEQGEEKQVVEDLENKKPKQEGGSGDATTNGVHKKADNSSEAMAST